jgi:hypothetical protein
MESSAHPPIRPFLLMEGGPLYNLERRIGLAHGTPPRTRRRAIAAALLTFVPLFILSALQHHAFGHVPVPFVRDFSTYTRFLLAVPLLIIAENILGPRIAEAVTHFIASGLVPEKDYARFTSFVDRGLRARDSVPAEIILAILAYILAVVSLRETGVNVSTWYSTRTGTGNAFTWAGWWLIAFCAPLFQFLVYRWIWRLFLWFQFLNRVRGLDLQLFPTHPDEAGGLGFVGETQRFFGIILFSLSLGSVGVLAKDIVFDKVPLQSFTAAIAVYVVISVLILVAPLALFAGLLLRTKRIGLEEYAALATAYTGDFHRKWIQRINPQNETLLGSGDIQSLADLSNSFSIIDKMKPLPIDLRTLLHLVVATLLPVAPLLLLVMPLKDLLKLIFKIFM